MMNKTISILRAPVLQACCRRGARIQRAAMLLLATLLLTMTAQTAWADGISYLDATGTQQSCTTFTTVESSSTSWNSGWCVVNSNTTISDRITVSGTVNLILTNNATLTASKGITVGSDATLNIYAQTDDETTMGALVASGANDNQQYNAGIGGVDNTAAGTITINGGKINATGMVGAGIGSGGQSGATVGTITINGGIVTAQDGSGYGAGIGGGGIQGKAGTINLNGGIINAAGIGSGYIGGDCSITVNISDGIRKIVATPVQGGACIGKGASASGTVTVNFISGGNIVTGDAKDAVFYDSGEGTERQIRAKALNHTVTMSDDLKANITATSEYAFTGETVTLTLGTSVDATTLSVNDGAVATTDAGNRQYTFTMPDGDVTVTATVLQTYAVNLPANMEVVSATNAADANGKYITGTTVTFKASFPYAASDVSDGTNTLTADDGVYSVTVADADIIVTATIERSATIDLTDAPGDFAAINNDVLTGSTSHTVTIADGAKITLNNATITGGIICNGSAEITLVGTNNVSNTRYSSAGIQIGGSGTTLTIKGDGSLTATGGSQAAGIGLGRTWDANATGGSIVIESGTVTASGDNGIGTGRVGNSKTATVGDIIIKGGTVNARLGSGYIYNGSSVTIGAIKIYDTIDKVDASAITESVTYMHVENETETDVTASASTYFTIIEDGDRRIIEKKDDTDYTITITDGIEHGTIACAAATAKFGDKVTITATPDFGYRLSRLVVKDAENNDVATTGNTFLMPKGDVTVSAVFEQGTHGTTEFAWGYTGPDGFVTDATIYDGVTTVELQQGQSYQILEYDEYDDYREFLLDNSTYAATIPYSGGTGTFPEYGNGTNFNLNDESGFYDITMTDVGNGKWSVSILKTVAVMDAVPDQTYTGSEITPEPIVLAGSLTLTKGTDYEYSYTNNTNVGTATVTVTFKGDYASIGSVAKTFTIVKATPTVTAPTPVEDLVYSGSAQALVTAGTTDFGTLIYSTDGENYSADIPTATDAGTYTVYYKVVGSDNWNAVDAQTVEVTIARIYTVTFNANGGEGTMEPMQLTYDGDWTALTANTFTRSGYGFKEWNTEPDGSGTNYYDEEEVYNLTDEVNGNVVLYAQWGWDIATCDIKGTLEAYDDGYGPYNQLSANVEVWNGDTKLTLDTDYTIELDPNIGIYDYVVGEQYQATIKGTGDWGGTKTFTFTFVALHHTIVFVANGGTGTMDDDTVANDGGNAGRYYLPECTFTAPLGKVFDHWVASCEPDAEKQPGDYFTTPYIWNESDVQTITVTAYWRDALILLDDDSAQPEGSKNADIIAANNGTPDLSVQLLGRTLYKDGSWNTLCLPFGVDLTATDCPLYGATARTVTEASISGSTLNLTFGNAVNTLEAGIPYIIKWDGDGTSNIENPVFEGVAIETTKLDYDTNTESVTTDERVRFCGTYKSTAFDSEDKSILLMGEENTLYYPAEGAGVGSFRAYFKIGDDGVMLARRLTSFTIDFGEGDNASGIIHVSAETRTNAEGWYSLDGRKLVGKPTQNGIYINNGKKVVIK